MKNQSAIAFQENTHGDPRTIFRISDEKDLRWLRLMDWVTVSISYLVSKGDVTIPKVIWQRISDIVVQWERIEFRSKRKWCKTRFNFNHQAKLHTHYIDIAWKRIVIVMFVQIWYQSLETSFMWTIYYCQTISVTSCILLCVFLSFYFHFSKSL